MKLVRAYSMVAHGVCWGLPQTSASVPLLATILFWAMRGSQPLYTALSACPLLYTLFDRVVEPQFSNGDWVMLLPLKNTSFPLPFVAELPSKKQNVMNLNPLIHEKVFVQQSPAPQRVEDALVNLFIN